MKKFLSILSVMVLLISCLSVAGLSTAAVDSPSGETLFNISYTTFNTGKSVNSTRTVKTGDTIMFTAEKSDYDFTGWVISGNYEIVAGGLNQKTITIRPLGDVTVEEAYNVPGSAGEGKQAVVVGSINQSAQSPQTGNQALALVSVVVLGAFSTMLFAKKRMAA